MADLLREGLAWLERMRATHCSSPVGYRRGASELLVDATFGRTDYEIADESGLQVTSHVWDFLVLAEQLGVEPKPGDLILAQGRRYEVMSLGGAGCWRWSDPYRITYRIHTRDIGAM